MTRDKLSKTGDRTEKREFRKELLGLAIPIGLQSLLVALIGASDALMPVSYTHLYHMLKGSIVDVCSVGSFHLRGADLAVRGGGQSQHLVSRGFHRTGFVYIDMAGVRAERALMGAQNGGCLLYTSRCV